MKVTGVPGQMVVAVEPIETDAITLACTVIVIPVLVAVTGLTQGELDVMMQVTTSPFVNPDVV